MKKIILIVDDEPDLREVIGMSFTLEGYTVIEASGGDEAIKLIQENTDIDAIISDVRMPLGDGVKLATEIQKLSLNIPMYLMTGYCDTDIEKMKTLGVSRVFTKPFDTDDIIKLLEKNWKIAS